MSPTTRTLLYATAAILTLILAICGTSALLYYLGV